MITKKRPKENLPKSKRQSSVGVGSIHSGSVMIGLGDCLGVDFLIVLVLGILFGLFDDHHKAKGDNK